MENKEESVYINLQPTDDGRNEEQMNATLATSHERAHNTWIEFDKIRGNKDVHAAHDTMHAKLQCQIDT